MKTAAFSDQLEDSMRLYARYVIQDRALPDVRDGLKPVHRRIIYATGVDLSLWHSRPPKKSARIVGEVLGKYHPHGDTAVYDAMVRMAQDFSMQLPLVDGHGNFGSIDGYGAAAMRYTEARLSPIGGLMLQDIDQDSVNFTPNFDDSLVEPTVLPAVVPNLLLNGSSGVAVAMATNIPPHNLGELCAAIDFVCRNWLRLEEVTIDDLLQHIQGPDFPTGGIAFRYRVERDGSRTDVIRELYTTGWGKITNQATVHIEEQGGGKSFIVITELPYATRKGNILEAIGKQVRDPKRPLEGIGDVRDESDHTGLRLVVETVRGHKPEKVLADLLQYTPLRTTFGGIMLALVPTANGDSYPEYLTIKQCVTHFILHRLVVIERRSRHERQKREDRLHIVQGLLVALDAVDEVIATIKKSRDRETARNNLQRQFKLTDRQAAAIVAMPLGNLANLEVKKLRDEAEGLQARIKELTHLIESESARLDVVVQETSEIKEQYARPRRTLIMDDEAAAGEVVTATDLMGPQIVSLYPDEMKVQTAQGYVDRTTPGLTARRTPVPIGQWCVDPAWRIFAVSRDGEIWHCPVAQINGGFSGKTAVGGGVITADDQHLVIVTQQGQVKRTRVTDFPRSVGQWARIIGLENGDNVLFASIERDENAEVMLFTRLGQAIRFRAVEVNPQASNTAKGVVAMKLEGDDTLLAGYTVVPGLVTSVAIISEHGFVKRVPLAEWPVQGRGGKGVRSLGITKATGNVTTAVAVQAGDVYIDLADANDLRLRLKVDQVPEDNRQNRGVPLIEKSVGDVTRGVALPATYDG